MSFQMAPLINRYESSVKRFEVCLVRDSAVKLPDADKCGQV